MIRSLAAYTASPECRRRQCVVYYERRSVKEGVYQHGENPEAVLVVPTILAIAPELSSVIGAMFQEFAERCHRYEDEVMA